MISAEQRRGAGGRDIGRERRHRSSRAPPAPAEGIGLRRWSAPTERNHLNMLNYFIVHLPGHPL